MEEKMQRSLNIQIFQMVTTLMILIPLIFFSVDFIQDQQKVTRCLKQADEEMVSDECQSIVDAELALSYHQRHWQKALLVEIIILLGIFLKIIHRRANQHL